MDSQFLIPKNAPLPIPLTSISFGAFNKISVSEIYLSKNLKGIGNGEIPSFVHLSEVIPF